MIIGISYRRCPETSVRNYHYSLRNNPEQRSSHLLRGGSQKSNVFMNVLDEHSGSIFSGHQKVGVVGSD
jgi:hypothetical protein